MRRFTLILAAGALSLFPLTGQSEPTPEATPATEANAEATPASGRPVPGTPAADQPTPEATPSAAANAVPTPATPSAETTPKASPTPSGLSDAAVKARSDALEIAGGFANDGFKARDGHWIGPIRTGEPQLIQVNLYAGNQYWFIAAASGEAKRLSVSVHDEKGAPVEFHPYQDKARAAAGFSPEISGPFYIRIEQEEGDPATFCLIYSYK